MGLSPQLAVILLFLLECTGNHIYGCDREHLREIINILKQVTGEGMPCTAEMFVPDVFTATKNTTASELTCRASKVLRKFYTHEKTPCLKENIRVLSELKRLYRALSCLQSPPESCTMNESARTSLKDFLESLRNIMQMGYTLSN